MSSYFPIYLLSINTLSLQLRFKRVNTYVAHFLLLLFRPRGLFFYRASFPSFSCLRVLYVNFNTGYESYRKGQRLRVRSKSITLIPEINWYLFYKRHNVPRWNLKRDHKYWRNYAKRFSVSTPHVNANMSMSWQKSLARRMLSCI